MNQNKNTALRQAAMTFVVKLVFYTAVIWFLGWVELDTPVWILAIGVLGLSAISGWEIYREWKKHFERRNQWED